MKKLDYYTVQDHSISVWSSTYKHMSLSNLFDASSNQPTPTGHHAPRYIKLRLVFQAPLPPTLALLSCLSPVQRTETLSQFPPLSPSSQSFNTCEKRLNFNHGKLSVLLYYSSQISLPIGNPRTVSGHAALRPHGPTIGPQRH